VLSGRGEKAVAGEQGLGDEIICQEGRVTRRDLL
jgi:hypothetical protein